MTVDSEVWVPILAAGSVLAGAALNQWGIGRSDQRRADAEERRDARLRRDAEDRRRLDAYLELATVSMLSHRLVGTKTDPQHAEQSLARFELAIATVYGVGTEKAEAAASELAQALQALGTARMARA